MFDALTEGIAEVEVPMDGAALVEAVALLDTLTAQVTMAVADFDAADLWDLDGAVSMSAWLRAQTAMANRDARRMVSTGKRMRAAPMCASGWLDGSLSSG